MALKQVILHVGLHKTATSSFQITCGANRQQLKKQSIHFPQFHIDKRKINNHSVPIFSLFCDQPEKYNTNIKWGYSNQIDRVNAAYQEQLDKAIDNHSKILLSGEDISILPPSGLDNFKRYLLRKGCELRVLCGVRKPYSFTCSEIQQKIRAGTLGDFQHAKVPQKSKRIETLQRTFENIEFFSFEADCLHPAGPVGALLERCAVDHSLIQQTDLNEGLGNITTRLYAEINKTHPVIFRGKLNPLGRDREVVNFDEGKFLLTPQELASMMDAIELENSEYLRLLGKEFTDSKYPTSKPFFIDLELASKILTGASRPPHVREAVEGFLSRHSDDNWNRSDLASIALTPLETSSQSSLKPQQQFSMLARAVNALRSLIRRDG